MDKKERINEIIREVEKGKTKDKEKSKIIKDFLIIDIGGSLFGLQLEYLREIIDLHDQKDIVSIPFTPEYIMGIINVRGEIIPCLSVLKILGIDESIDSYKKIAILDEKFKTAFPFTEIIDLKAVDIKDIKAVKNASKISKEQLITQEFDYNKQVINIIDILKLYSSEFLN